MSAHFVTALVVLSLVSPTVAYAQDSLTVEKRLSRTETQLAAVMARTSRPPTKNLATPTGLGRNHPQRPPKNHHRNNPPPTTPKFPGRSKERHRIPQRLGARRPKQRHSSLRLPNHRPSPISPTPNPRTSPRRRPTRRNPPIRKMGQRRRSPKIPSHPPS